MFTWKRLVLACAGLILLTLLFVTLLLPGILVTKAQDWVAAETGRALSIGSVSINPLSLTVEIRDLSLSEQDHAQRFVAWDLLRVSLSPKSIIYRAPVISELRLDRPVINLERKTADTFNFSDLVPAKTEEAPNEAPGEAARFSVSNLVDQQWSGRFYRQQPCRADSPQNQRSAAGPADNRQPPLHDRQPCTTVVSGRHQRFPHQHRRSTEALQQHSGDAGRSGSR